MTMKKALVRALAAEARSMSTLALTRAVDALRSVTRSTYSDPTESFSRIAQRRVYALELRRREATRDAFPKFATHVIEYGTVHTLSTPIRVF